MEKLPMCRICLAENIRMYVVVNKNLHELYERLTDIPFVTADSRPILACSFCYAKLKQCFGFLRKCLKAEELFTQIMNGNYEPNSLINQDPLEVAHGFINSPIENISIVELGQTESVVVKEELPADCERQDDILEPKEEYQCDELENVDNSRLDEEEILPHGSEFNSEDDLPLMEIKIEEDEGQEASKETRPALDTKRPTVAEEPKLLLRRTELEDSISADQKKNQISDSKNIRTTQNRTVKLVTKFKKLHECDLSKLRTKRDFIRHVRTHTGEKPYKCEICQSSFSQKGNLTRHIRTHTGEKPYKCDICQSSFGEKVRLTRHVRTHTGEKPYKCGICQSSFSEKGRLTRHVRTHTGEKPYKCDTCQSSFSQKGNLTRHIRTHTGEKPYKCGICQSSFSEKGRLTRHVRTHTGEKPYKCDTCQSSFSQKINLTNHIRTHTGEKLYKCEKCQSSFSQKIHLTNHFRTHTGEKPYKCDICQKSFSVKNNLTKHVRTHTAEKRSKCNICHCKFRKKTDLMRHVRAHTSDKPYKCDICQSSFSEKVNLTGHARTHTDEKP